MYLEHNSQFAQIWCWTVGAATFSGGNSRSDLKDENPSRASTFGDYWQFPLWWGDALPMVGTRQSISMSGLDKLRCIMKMDRLKRE